MKRVLHLYSNHKWTGPADHALNLVSWLNGDWGAKAFFSCSYRQGLQNQLYKKTLERKIPLIEGMHLRKHSNWRIIPDIFALKRIAAHNKIDMIHSHQDNDALTAVLAGLGKRLIRTCYDGEPRTLSIRQRHSYRQTAKIMTASSRVQAYLSKMFPQNEIEQVDIPVDLDRFRPRPKSKKLRVELGLKTQDPVAGIVARVQKHKNFPLLLDAIEQVIREIPDLKFLIVGRGTHIETLARQPVKRRGLEKNVIFTGYRKDDYRDVLNLFDFKVFLSPGSDGSCRAVREALACGKPVIAIRKGILPELISDGETGILVEDQPEALTHAMITMFKENEFRQICSKAALRYAETILSPDRYVNKICKCYEALGSAYRQNRTNNT